MPPKKAPKLLITSLPAFTGDDAEADPPGTFELSMFFADKPFSVLTPEHGFDAEVYISPTSLPGRHETARVDTPFFRRAEKLRAEKNWYFSNADRKPVRCLIDESSDFTMCMKTVDSVRVWLDDDERASWVPRLGCIRIANDFILGTQVVNLVIHGRIYCMEMLVVDELFPGHTGVGIQVLLGKDFLRMSPGLVFEPVFRGVAGIAVDLVPWDSGYRGENFEINGKGELVAYVSGYEEEGGIDSEGEKLENRGFFGVYFGPDSEFNMSSESTSKEVPLSEAAVVEGAMCIVFTILLGRMATWTSVRICTDAGSVVDALNPKALKGYAKRSWTTKKGKLLNLHCAFRNWADHVLPQITRAKFPWMKKDLLAFEKVDRKNKGLQAARHLARSARDSCFASTGDRGAVVFSTRNGWDGYLFTHIPGRNYITRVRHPRESFIKNRKLASAKAPEVESFPPAKIARVVVSAFFPSTGPIGVVPFSEALELDGTFTALQILAISPPGFVEGVLRLAREKGRIKRGVELLGIEDGNFYFGERLEKQGKEGGGEGEGEEEDDDKWMEEVTVGLGLNR